MLLGTTVLAACQTSSPSPALPPATQQAKIQPDKAVIKSTCGTSINIVYPQTVKCKFSEQGYNGTFSIKAASLEKMKIASVVPKVGTSKTTFKVIAGPNPGFGSFLVVDTKSRRLKIKVIGG